MAKILIHSIHGPEAPTQADRAFLIAESVLEEGHELSMFLAGSAVSLIKDEFLNTTIGIGEGVKSLGERLQAITEAGGKIYLSQISCGARGVTADDLKGKKVELGPPNLLVQLTVDHDKVITYG